MQLTFSSPDEYEQHSTAIQQARAIVMHHVKEVANTGQFQTIALDQRAFICTLALGPLAARVTEGLVTIPMLERWVMEAISQHAHAHDKPLLTARDIYQLSQKAGDPAENLWTWCTLPDEVQDYYERMADLLNEALNLCASCGERKPNDLHDVAGMLLCSACIRPPQEGATYDTNHKAA